MLGCLMEPGFLSKGGRDYLMYSSALSNNPISGRLICGVALEAFDLEDHELVYVIALD